MFPRYKFQLFVFFLGVTCAVPAKSFADDFEDVLDDLMTYRHETRVATGKQDAVTIEESLNKAVKKQPLDSAARTVPGKSKNSSDAPSARKQKVLASSKAK